jgi:CRP/FNR family transcriptional regulator, cyclic AMP receptor protein
MDAAQLLARTNLFDDLSPEDVRDLAEHLKLHRFAAGEKIFGQGEAGDSMFLVVDGTVSIYLVPGEGSARVPLREVAVGQYFGELSLFDAKPRSAGAEASTECEVLELERDVLRDHIQKRPHIAISLLDELSARLRETNALLSQRAAKDVNKMIDEKATLGDRVADRVASVAGSWTFILSFLAVLAGWVTLNGVAISKLLTAKEPFDPFPFIFFNLILSIVAAFQGPVIMMSQNRQAIKDRAQAEIDFKVNLKNEVGIEGLSRTLAEIKAHMAVLERGQAPAKPRPESAPANGGGRAG